MTKKCIPGLITIMLTAFLLVGSSAPAATNPGGDEAPGRKMAKQAVKREKRWITTDHTKHEILQKPFMSGEEVTQACLSCHSEASAQFHKTIHWTWLASGDKKDMKYGKAGYSVNNFCISANAMEDKSCLKCHAGWNGVDEGVNCLKCHGTEKFNYKEAFTDIQAFAQDDDPESKEIMEEIQAEVTNAVGKIALPGRNNCGECHFKGGGGDGVKHGDLDTSLMKPNKILDVHMGTDGEDFSCTRCHTTTNHNIAGRVYTNPAVESSKSLLEDDLAPKITCISCHSDAPHKNDSKMNDHTDKVSCQACHIPEYARVNPTKMSWDWAKAGDLKDGKPYHTKGELGKDIYKSIKGQMTWEKNVVPEYFWSNGTQTSTTAEDIIDPSTVVKVSHPVGDAKDPDSRIFPFKIHRGNQPYDKINKTLLAPLLSGEKGYWTTFNWEEALTLGNDTLGLPFSGEFDFVKTTYAFPITHMVAPKDKALDCTQCHRRDNGRLATLSGFYMPGRDKSTAVDSLGWIIILGSLGGVGLHGLGRFFTRKNGRRKNHG
ncbi:octaheme c-type cytochrome, tetrathionate reductase family [Desulfocicer vacuolatum DSM 3385]|uniref:Octaheme c-type cytochrome, tetrathionate reductase family n=1 Tax=Desulfocicer vacuolatum DSM 3385 TaxID=1121400 RepID=A0A1W2APV7_9BACT|nr:tetrathionate reductase family octaheme c-type cytochrome [Desulfocicer vacuolatum]SMC62759.1 octaheme c-type cytochrome, tetrathionate reductase family [Desulfocicer vacuolatum DSM 3385]